MDGITRMTAGLRNAITFGVPRSGFPPLAIDLFCGEFL